MSRIARYLAQLAEQRGDSELVPFSDEVEADILIILCGCPRACVDKKEVREKAKRCLLIAGESVDRRPIPGKDLPHALERELDKILTQLGK